MLCHVHVRVAALVVGWNLWMRTKTGVEGYGQLQFETCHGLANQRLCLVFGVVVAKDMGLELVLPDLPRNGIEGKNAPMTTDFVPFDAMYDERHFRTQLEEVGVRFAEAGATIPSDQVHVCDTKSSWRQCKASYLASRTERPHLKFGCPFLTPIWDGKLIGTQEKLALQVLQALVPSERIANALHELKQVLKIEKENNFHVLHLRAETDWEEHCTVWKSNGLPTDCFGNLSALGDTLEMRGFSRKSKLYVATDWRTIGEQGLRALERLRTDYQVISRPAEWKMDSLLREELACVDYYLSFDCRKFIGNSVSTFTALLLLERRDRHLWASYYNTGDIPLQHVLPVYKFPWIFSIAGKKYDYMIKPAVRSALQTKNIQPYALVHAGLHENSTLEWLQQVGVRCIFHRPLWRDIVLRLKMKTPSSFKGRTHLLEETSLHGTFIRLDIPLIEEFLQYEHILYTDVDIFFRAPVPFYSAPRIMPQTISMDFELAEHFPMNAGVYLANLQFLGKTHDKLIQSLRQATSLDFESYGPVDQGLLNLVYENELRKGPNLPPNVMNAKPYKPYESEAWIVHFHGPKPEDYARFLAHGRCRFRELCRLGTQNGVCKYLAEWLQYCSESDLRAVVENFCNISLPLSSK